MNQPTQTSRFTNGSSQERWTPEMLSKDALYFEYVSSVNPNFPDIPALLYPSALHQGGESRLIPFDLSKQLQMECEGTSPNVSAAYVRICKGESFKTQANASAQLFYVIRGQGHTETDNGPLCWAEGDVLTLPATGPIEHFATEDTALYWVNDSPLLNYLGVTPDRPRFQPAYYPKDRIMSELAKVDAQSGSHNRNRDAVILGNPATFKQVGMTHTLWSAVVYIAAGEIQRPHKHNSVAVDIIMASQQGCYSYLGKEIDAKGDIINPQRVDWEPGAAFVTPPGLWHAHFNESDKPSIVMAVQDASFHQQMRTLDIQFAPPAH